MIIQVCWHVLAIIKSRNWTHSNMGSVTHTVFNASYSILTRSISLTHKLPAVTFIWSVHLILYTSNLMLHSYCLGALRFSLSKLRTLFKWWPHRLIARFIAIRMNGFLHWLFCVCLFDCEIAKPLWQRIRSEAHDINGLWHQKNNGFIRFKIRKNLTSFRMILV